MEAAAAPAGPAAPVGPVDPASPAPARAATAPARADLLAAQKDNIAQLSEISRHSQTTFLALIVACVYSYLTIATTTDAALLSNSNATPLPIIQVNVPIVWFYWFAPVILTVLFVYFHLYLERFWRGVARLPLRHPDGRSLDDYVYPWLIACAVIRGEIGEFSGRHRVAAQIEAWLSLLLGWGLVPIVLLFYWGRYIVAHDPWGTTLHAALVLLSIGVAMNYRGIARNALREVGPAGAQPAEEGGAATPPRELGLTSAQRRALIATLLGSGAALAYVSSAALHRASMPDCDAVIAPGQGAVCRFLAPGRRLWHAFGVEPYAEVKENRFVPKPEKWNELVDDSKRLEQFLEGQRSLVLADRDLRHLVARESFMPGSRFSDAVLDHADMRFAVLVRARLTDVSLRRARLDDVDLRHAQIAGTEFEDLQATSARLNHALFQPSPSGRPSRLSGIFSELVLDDAKGDGVQVNARDGDTGVTQMTGAKLRNVQFAHWVFHRVDLGDAVIEGATLTNGKWQDVDFGGTTIFGSFFNVGLFTRCRFIGAKIQDSYFDEARFIDSEFDMPRSTPVPGDGPVAAQARGRIERFQAHTAVFGGGTRIRNLHFVRAVLIGARFEGATLHNVLFEDSDLSLADFSGVDLSGVEFRGRVELNGAKLAGARGVTTALLAGACGIHAELPPGMTVQPCPTTTTP
ncbi:MAG: pentapeptide repeat-containing protein [Rubrivivax sp.]|nr:pentapeptide repeat-containing protein [Rubrivivax sp.]